MLGLSFNVKDYSAKGDGVTDDTVAIQAAIDAWHTAARDINQTGATLVFPPGRYKTTAPLSVSFSNNNTLTKLISGYGAIIKPAFSSGHALDVTVSAGQVRNLTIAGLHIDGTSLTDTTSALLHLGGGTVGALYRCVCRDVALEGAAGHGVLIDGLSYEHQFYSCRINEISTGNTTGYGYKISNAGGGAVSSIDIYGGTVSGFLRNLDAITPQGGVKIFGGSWLQAYNEGIYIENATEAGIWGAHVENAWQGGAASPSWTTSQAGVTVIGLCSLFKIYGTQNNAKMRYVVRVSAADVATIVGGMVGAGCDYYLRAEGAANSNVTVIGTSGGASGRTHNALPSTGRLIEIGSSGGPPIKTYIGSGAAVIDTMGSGSPEGAITAGIGSTYKRTDGGASTSFYVKESGAGNTGWIAK